MHGISIATAWNIFLGVLVPIKVALFGVGYIAWVLAAPSGAKRRASLLEHIHTVLATMLEIGKSPDATALNELRLALAHLDARVSAGWKSHEDLATLLRLLKFVSGVHIRETRDAVDDLTESAWKFVIDSIEAMLPYPPQNADAT